MQLYCMQIFIITARCSYASAVLGVVILSVCPSVTCVLYCFVTNPKNLPAIFLYNILITAKSKDAVENGLSKYAPITVLRRA